MDINELFTKFIENSRECRGELVQEAYNLVGIPVDGTNTTSKFFRLWMNYKYALYNKKMLLNQQKSNKDNQDKVIYLFNNSLENE